MSWKYVYHADWPHIGEPGVSRLPAHRGQHLGKLRGGRSKIGRFSLLLRSGSDKVPVNPVGCGTAKIAQP